MHRRQEETVQSTGIRRKWSRRLGPVEPGRHHPYSQAKVRSTTQLRGNTQKVCCRAGRRTNSGVQPPASRAHRTSWPPSAPSAPGQHLEGVLPGWPSDQLWSPAASLTGPPHQLAAIGAFSSGATPGRCAAGLAVGPTLESSRQPHGPTAPVGRHGRLSASPSRHRHSADIDNLSMNSSPGSFSNSCAATFTLPDRLPAPRMM